MDANSRNWQTTRSYRWMKTPPDPRRNTSSRVFNVVLLFSPEKRRKNVLTSREHGFHCINFTVMIMISLVETLVIFRFEGEEFPFIVFVSRRRSRRSVNAPRLPLGIGRIPRACSPSRSRNFSWIGVIGRLCEMSMDFRAFWENFSNIRAWKLRIFSKLFEPWNGTC